MTWFVKATESPDAEVGDIIGYLLHHRQPVSVWDRRLSAEKREASAELVGRLRFYSGVDRLYNAVSYLTAAAMWKGVRT